MPRIPLITEAGMINGPRRSALDDLAREVAAELELFAYPTADWVRPLRNANGNIVHNVVIVGGGQAGLAIAFGLQREHISGVVVLDENAEGQEGPWVKYARMVTLRTLKFLTGPDLGLPSLTFRRWHQAHYGAAAWDGLIRIDRAEWMRYLTWFRDITRIDVRNHQRLVHIEPRDGLWSLRLETPAGPATMLTREVVLATGLDGAGAKRVPDFVRANLPDNVWAHTADPIDFETLRGRSIAVMGGGASAYDNAATALEHGAARVDIYVRRAAVPMINFFRALESSGFWGNFADLDDAARWRFMHRVFSFPMPPPQDTVARVLRHANARVHFGTGILNVSEGIRLETAAGPRQADFLIVGTGFTVDLSARPELSAILPHIATWADRYDIPDDKAQPEMARHPYLGSGFQTMGTIPELARLRLFNGGAMVSMGPVATGLNGMPFGVPRLIKHISRGFLRDQAGLMLEEFEHYDEPDAWEAFQATNGSAS